MSVGKTSTALGAFYRRLAARLGKAKAITATARKLALFVYRVLSGQLLYHDPGAAAYHQLHRAPATQVAAQPRQTARFTARRSLYR